MTKLIPVANKLFEKWTNGLDRTTQHATWNAVAEECQIEGICCKDGLTLKNYVTTQFVILQARITSGISFNPQYTVSRNETCLQKSNY